MNPRRFLTAVAACLVTGLMAGCAGATPAPAETSPAAPAPAPNEKPSGEITFWSAIGGMDAVTEKFNSSQDDISVKFQEIPNGANGGYAQLSAALTSNTGPDVVGIEYPQLPQFVANQQLQPLDDIVGEDVLSQYPDQVRGLVTFGDQTFGMPYDAAPLVFYYRSDVLKAAGVEVPKTWDEFRAAAEVVRKHDPKAYLVSFNPNEPAIVAALSWKAGAQWFGTEGDSWKIGVNDETSAKVAAFWQGLVDDDLVKVQPSFSDEWTADLGSGVTVGLIGASWSAAGLKARTEGTDQAGKWIAAQPPSWDAPSSAFYGGTSFVMTKDSKNTAAAAEFLKFLTTDPEAIKARGEVGSAYLAFPGLTEQAKSVFPVDYFANDIYSVFDESAASVVKGWQWGPNWDITSTALKDNLASVGAAGTIPAALEKSATLTVDGLKQLGLSVK